MSTVSIRLETSSDRLQIVWADGTTSSYPWLWLRDHAHDAATLHPVTRQRQLHTASIDPQLRCREVSVVDGGAGEVVRIVWASDEQSDLPLDFLASFRTPGRPAITVPDEPVLWDTGSLGAAPTTPWVDIMERDEAVGDWLTQVATHGFAIATGTPATLEATAALVERVGYVRETVFGGMWQFTADLAAPDTAYTDLDLAPHTDGTYSHDAPGLQLLHCLHFEGDGGLSSIVDGFRVAAELRESEPQHYEVLSRVSVPGQYLAEGVHLVAARPVLRHDASGRLVQVSYNTSDRAPFLLPDDEMLAWYDAMRAFDQLTNDPRLQWRHRLAPGEAMLFDNWRVLHGRTSYSGVRTMCGAYVNHEDFESRLRTIRAVAGRHGARAGAPARA